MNNICKTYFIEGKIADSHVKDSNQSIPLCMTFNIEACEIRYL